MKSRKISIIYDAEEDRWHEESLAKGEPPDPPVHFPLGEVLEQRGHKVKKLKAETDVLALTHAIAEDRSEIIFNACDGLGGVTARATQVASLMELLGKRFTGSGSEGLCLTQDKVLTKQLFTHHQIPTPRFAVLDRGHLEWADQLNFPLIVKPTDEDASIGINDSSVVRDVKSLLERVSWVHGEIGRPALIEEYVEGREIYAVVVGNQSPDVLPLLEWPLSPGPTGARVATYGAKWDPLHPDYQDTADQFARDLAPEVVETIERAAIKAYRALRLKDYARMDLRLAENGVAYFIEVNPNPFLDPTAEVAMAAQARGLDFADLAEWIITLALERYQPPRRRPVAAPPKKAASPARRTTRPSRKKTASAGGKSESQASAKGESQASGSAKGESPAIAADAAPHAGPGKAPTNGAGGGASQDASAPGSAGQKLSSGDPT